jgi:uncharacterized protein YciW
LVETNKHPDYIRETLDVQRGSSLDSLLAQRAAIMAMTQSNAEAVLTPKNPGGLSPGFRAALAVRIARGSGEERLASLYDRLRDTGDDELEALAHGAPSKDADRRVQAMVAHLDLVTASPWQAGREAIAALVAAGVGEDDIVRLSQLAACISYQVRVVAGLRLLGEDA